jgi:hypothetical protein
MHKFYNDVSYIWDNELEAYVAQETLFKIDEETDELVIVPSYPITEKVVCFGGGGGDEGGSTTTVQKSDPWSGQQPYLTKGFEEALKGYNSGSPKYYPGNTVVPFSPETQLALNMQANRALNGSPIQGAATNQLTSTLNGDYLYGGQGFNQAVDAATRRILPQVNSSFESAGRTGSGLAKTAQTQAISDAFANQYGQERENQMRSMFFAPQIAAQDYQDIGMLADVGAQREGLSQQQLAADIDKFNYNENLQRNKLADYMGLIQGNYGGSSMTQMNQPLYRNQGASMLGGMLSGASMGSKLFPLSAAQAAAGATPWGMIGGAGVGLLGGLLDF